MDRNKDIELLHEISTQTSSLEQYSCLHDYLQGFLTHSFGLFAPDDNLLYINVHYFSPHLQQYSDSESGWLTGFPTLFDIRKVSKTEFKRILQNVLAFIAGARLMMQKARPVSDAAMSAFQGKFIATTIRRLKHDKLSKFIEFDPYNHLLKQYYPDVHQKEIGETYFKSILSGEAEREFVLEKAPHQYLILNGQKFDDSIDTFLASSESEKFEQKIYQFLARSENQNYIHASTLQMEELIQKLRWPIDISMARPFVFLTLLHCWIKDNRYTYFIPISTQSEGFSHSHFILMLLATESHLPIDKLNKLHIALNLALGALRQLEQRILPAKNKPGMKRAASLQNFNAGLLHQPSAKGSMKWQMHQQFGMIGKSEGMQALFKKITQVARFDTDVMILGESGVGKELVARAIHQNSNRANGPYLVVSLAERSDQLIASELFGHEKGAFTGATEGHQGYFERAHGGTLFLDEIAQVPQSIQAKLLRVLESRQFERLGGKKSIQADVRIISATSENLRNQQIREKIHFQHQLYYRLEKYIIEVPPLRDRKEDIPLLADYFLNQFDKTQRLVLHPKAVKMLLDYPWPGNIREISNVIHRACINAYDEGEIRGEHLEFSERDLSPSKIEELPQPEAKILQALRISRFNIGKTSKHLARLQHQQMDRRTVMRHCREFCLVFLSRKNWNLRMAIKSLAGDERLETFAAKKFQDYFLGDKPETGIFNYLGSLEKKSGENFAASLVRKKFYDLLMEFSDHVRNGTISPDEWKYILSHYFA